MTASVIGSAARDRVSDEVTFRPPWRIGGALEASNLWSGSFTETYGGDSALDHTSRGRR
jgi:hypothetical protein